MKRMTTKLLSIATVLLMSVLLLAAVAQIGDDFDLTDALVPTAQIESGGPSKGGIPAIDRPKFVKAVDARFLQSNDRVLGITRNGIAKAYPVRILNWHEIVNDSFGHDAIAVTFCPLCGTGMAYLSKVNGKSLSFGVSGLLYNSDVLLFDRQTQSLWSQILAQAVSGPLKGEKLTSIAITHTSWIDWKRRHPNTLVLSTDTGFARDYNDDPYAGYAQDPGILFRVNGQNKRYHPKESVIGIEIGGVFKAYPFVELAKIKSGSLTDTVGGKQITVRFDPEHRTGAIFDAKGQEMPSVIAYWFAWYAFHQDTEIFQPK